MTGKTWAIFAALCVAVLGGMIWVSQSDKIDVTNVNIDTLQTASAQNGGIADHTEGKADSKVVLIEYGDYQCPGCGSAYPIIKQVVDKYKDQITFVFRNYPLYSAHPNAFSSASAAEAAGLQGKFWEMHDKLFTNQNSWKDLNGTARTDYYVNLASQLSLDVDKFKADLDNPDVKKKIDFDAALGKKAQVTGTPSFYLNGKSIGDQYVLDGKIVPRGTSGAALVWTDADAFGKLVIEPALKEAGIPTAE